jgi:hypothetical protein
MPYLILLVISQYLHGEHQDCYKNFSQKIGFLAKPSTLVKEILSYTPTQIFAIKFAISQFIGKVKLFMCLTN